MTSAVEFAIRATSESGSRPVGVKVLKRFGVRIPSSCIQGVNGSL